jgi:DNA-binding transcriptional regulator GbsR (MarR family)
MNKKIFISLSLVTSLLISAPVVTFAQTATPSPRTTIKENLSQDRISFVKSKAQNEIDRRITSINEVMTKIQGLKRLTDSDKTNLVAMGNSMITSLNKLKIKINADTDLTTLRADQKSIFDQYRIYMLFMPQLRIYVAADRIDDTVTLMSQVLTKLQARATTDTQKSELTDAQNKLNDAKLQADNAINAIKNLQPDQGNDGMMSSNKQALLTAKDMIKLAMSDLQAARHDFELIRKSLPSPSASPTATP